MTFRQKIVLGIALLQAAMLFVLIYHSLDFLRTSNERELQKRADTAVRLFASSAKDAVLTTNLASLESLVAEVLTNPDIAYARVLDGRGVLAQGGSAEALALPFRADASIGKVEDGIYDAVARIDVADVGYGRVEIGLSVAAIDSVMRRARGGTLIFAAAMIGVVAGFSFLLGLYLTRGLDALTEGTRRLAAGELGYQIAARGKDELAATALAFNHMSRELEAAARERRRTEADLVGYRDHLEQLVAQRTEDLTRANRDLAAAHHQVLQSEKMASIGQLAAGVAHEINNPIGFVISNMGRLEEYLRGLVSVIEAYERNADVLAGHPERLLAIEAVRGKADLDFLRQDIFALLAESDEGLLRVKKIVQNLKDFSHAGESAWQIVDLHRGLDSTLDIVANEFRGKADVTRNYGDLPEVECMPLELNQVFMNLLANAGQAITGRGAITIATGSAGNEVWVEIADNGGGIAPEHLGRIFDPFFTTKPVGLGTGLGLSVSYSIVQNHHGRIDVASILGEGSRFRVRLPVRQPERAA